MKRLIGLSASVVLSLTLAGLAVVGACAPFGDLAEMLGLFRRISIPAIPVAVYFAVLVRDYLTTRAQDRVGIPRLILEAHVLGLSLSGLLLVMVLAIAGMFSPVPWGFFATAVAACVAGGSGLAWGALGCLLEST
jgi:hypothetical protein